MSVERNDPLEEQPMADASLAEETGQVEPVAVGPGDPDPTHPGNGAAGPDQLDDRAPDRAGRRRPGRAGRAPTAAVMMPPCSRSWTGSRRSWSGAISASWR